jgi:NAD+ kinase
MKFGIIVNLNKPRAQPVVQALVPWLRSQNVTPCIEPATARALGFPDLACEPEQFLNEVSLVMALGGDGTLLRTARLVGNRGIAIMGINLGALGFLTGFAAEEIENAVGDFLSNRHRQETRVVLAARLGDEEFFALNDFTITMGPSCRIIELAIYVQKEYVCKFVADGVIVATPTGSTAYSLAAGGPIAFPSMDAFLVTPICAHALSFRPLVLPTTERFEIELGDKSEGAVLTIDGQEQRAITPRQRVSFSPAPYKIRLVVPKTKTFYEILRKKMKWGGREDA